MIFKKSYHIEWTTIQTYVLSLVCKRHNTPQNVLATDEKIPSNDSIEEPKIYNMEKHYGKY